MIYLFSSASRPLYVTDALSVLALPGGASIVHRYRCGGERQHVTSLLASRLARTRKAKGSSKLRRERDFLVRAGSMLRRFPLLHYLAGLLPEPTPVLISFVDRYGSKGYVYHPLRLGTLYDAWIRHDRLYVRVRLGELVAAVHDRVNTVSDALKEALAEGRPPEAAADRDSHDDHNYVVEGVNVLGDRSDVVHDDRAWAESVKSLVATKALGMGDKQAVVYVRADLQQMGSDGEPLRPTMTNDVERVLVRKNAMYELRVSYQSFSPVQAVQPVIKLESGSGIQLLEENDLSVNAQADDIPVPLVTSRFGKDLYSFVRLRVAGESNGVGVIGPKVNLLLTLQERRGYRALVFGIALVVALANLVIAIDPTKITAGPLSSWPATLLQQATAPRVVAALIETAGLLALFSIVGEKPL